jgi:hypothetical protein
MPTTQRISDRLPSPCSTAAMLIPATSAARAGHTKTLHFYAKEQRARTARRPAAPRLALGTDRGS